jgi:hypothetical protein
VRALEQVNESIADVDAGRIAARSSHLVSFALCKPSMTSSRRIAQGAKRVPRESRAHDVAIYGAHSAACPDGAPRDPA